MTAIEIWSRALLVVCAVIVAVPFIWINAKTRETYTSFTTFLILLGCLGLSVWTLIDLAAKVYAT